MKKTLLAALCVSASCFTLNAATWTVTSTEAFANSTVPSNTEGSLSKIALSQAANGDVITFDSSLDGQTIQFSAKLTFKSGTSGFGVTIDASNLPNGIIFDGTSSTQILGLGDDYQVGAAGNYDFVVKNITFRNGKSVADAGGAMSIFGKKVTIENCRFFANENATSSANYPGAIRIPVSFADITFSNCVFKNNVSLNKGGVFSVDASNIIISNCLFEGNSANQGGGVIVMKSATPNPATNALTIINSTFVDNEATNGSDDGIVINNGGSSTKGMALVLTNCTFVGNSTPGSSKSTVYSVNRPIVISGCIFGNNKSNTSFVGAEVKISDAAGTSTIDFQGYNVGYQFYDSRYKSSPFVGEGTNVRYTTWTSSPYLTYDATKGVCVPAAKAIADGYWTNIYNIPTASMKVTTDQLGNARGAKGCIGAYQFAHQLTMVDAQGTTTPAAGTYDYLKGSSIALSSTSSTCVFKSNGQKVNSPVMLNSDMTITADYSSSIANLKIDGVSFEGGVLFVKGKAGKVLNVFGIGGNLLLSTTIQGDAAAINLNELGRVVFVQLDGERLKLVL